MLSGIDVSECQGEIDWAKVADSGISFVFVRAAHGASVSDRFFQQNCSGCRAAKIPYGTYQYFDADANPVDQVAFYINLLQLADANDSELPPVLDLESVGTKGVVSNAELQLAANSWLTAVKAATGRTPIIYTGPSFWNSHMQGFKTDGYALWVAHWGVQKPQIPAGWQDWVFWQHSHTGTVSGISGPVDLDWFSGDIMALNAL